MTSFLTRLRRLWRHRWLDASDARHAIPPELVQRLMQRVAASERRHTGEIRICVEASLPSSYLWREWREGLPLRRIVRERALAMFGKLRCWDTEHNNGVLIYLLLAEQAIEIVADRGLARHVDAARWQDVVGHMSAAFRAGRYEDGLTQALEEVSALLVAHFPETDGASGPAPNQLPDEPVVG